MVTHGAIQAEIADCRLLVEELPPSRERSLALTKLDEAEMWADRAPLDQGNGDALADDPWTFGAARSRMEETSAFRAAGRG